MTDKIKPCPHCGGEPTTDLTLPECAVEHVWMIRCCAEMEGFATEEEAIKAWNKRSND